MKLLSGQSAAELFADAAHLVLADGVQVAPRGKPTLEVLGVQMILTQPRCRLIHLPPTRVLNSAFAVAEALWILSGSDNKWIFDFNSQLAQYADNGVLQGAYGPRLRRWHGVDQLDTVRRRLLEDPDTRQAVVQLFDPARDHSGHSDVPCTIGYRFFLRGNQLHMHTSMRSQDLWMGFPYDVFTATLIQELVAGWIGAEVGVYRHSVDSLHLYAQHWQSASQLPAEGSGAQMPPVNVAWERLDDTLAAVIGGRGNHANGEWDVFARTLASYRRWKSGQREAAQSLAATIPGVLGEAMQGWYAHLASGALAAVPG
jgi:thymidylate synthase